MRRSQAIRRQEQPLPAAVETLLARRAARLRAPQQLEVHEQLVPIAELAVGDQRFALHLSQLRAALPLKLVTPVPLAPAHVVGIFSFAGQTLCVNSLSALLGVRGWRVDPAVVLVVEPAPSRFVALDSEHVPETTEISLATLDEARSRSEGPTIRIERPSGPLWLVDDLQALLERRGVVRAG